MGLKNEPTEPDNTGKNHLCYETGYAPDDLSVIWSGMFMDEIWYPSKPLPKLQAGTVSYVHSNLYVGVLQTVTILLYNYPTYSQFQAYFNAGGAAGGGRIDGVLCPIAIAGAQGSPHIWQGGTLSIRMSLVGYKGERAIDYGDLVGIPHDSEMFSEIQVQSNDDVSIRFARHRDKTNLLIKCEM